MFSEENIKRTKEKLVEYVKDNAYSFTRRGSIIRNGRWGGYWDFSTEELSVKPIDDAIRVLGSSTAIDIIVETLNDVRGYVGSAEYNIVVPEEPTELTFLVTDEDKDEDYYDDYDEDDYGYDGDYNGFYDEDDEDDEDEYEVFIGGNSPSSLYEWFTQADIKSSDITELIEEFDDEREDVSDKEMVNHPPHYNQGKFETIDIIEDIVAGYDDPVEAYLVGTTLKYLARAPFKGAKKQDLEKAEFYLKRAIGRQQQQ